MGEFVAAVTNVVEVVDREAAEIGELYTKAKSSLIDSVRYQMDCGRRLVAKKASMPHGSWLPWLRANESVLGFGDRSAQLLIKGSSNPQLTSDLNESTAVAVSRQVWGNHNHRAQYTGEYEWYTPAEYVDLARAAMGGIDLDPASSEVAQGVVKAQQYFTAADDGLTRDWRGRVWLNPPYSQPLIQHFADKLIAEVRAGRVDQAIVLTHNSTDTAWFHNLEEAAVAVCFTRGRIAFVDPLGDRCAPTQGQAFFYFGNRTRDFAQTFASVGFLTRKLHMERM